MAFKNNNRINHSDIETIKSDIESFKNEFLYRVGTEIKELDIAGKEFILLKGGELFDLYQRVESLIEQIQDMISELKNRDGIKLDTSEAIQLTSTVSILELELNSLLSLLEKLDLAFTKLDDKNDKSFIGKAKHRVQKVISSIQNVLRPFLKKVSQRLWKLISGLLTPKEWSIGGEIGNSVFGLGSVKIEIKFGT